LRLDLLNLVDFFGTTTSYPLLFFVVAANVFEGREEASSQVRQEARTILVVHTSVAFEEDTEDMASMLYRTCRVVGAHGLEENLSHNGGAIVLLRVSRSHAVYLILNHDLFKYRIVAVMLPPTFALSVFLMAAATLLFGRCFQVTNTVDSDGVAIQGCCWDGHGETLPWPLHCLFGVHHF